ncbi:S-phase kinase-associated protein 1A [Xylaria cf. heliscus]|nr:S-phase kinase-associated protein 1A [Xylaria cf. heliscus]
MSTKSLATLVSSDGVEIQTTYEAVKQSVVLGTMLEVLDEELTTDQPIPVPGVEGDALKKVMEWCEHHREDPIPKPDDQPATKTTITTKITEVPSWDAEFFKFDKDLVLQVTNAANYLEIPLLLDYATIVIADNLKGMTTQQMREYLNVKNDFTPEEEERIRQENAWVTEGDESSGGKR